MHEGETMPGHVRHQTPPMARGGVSLTTIVSGWTGIVLVVILVQLSSVRDRIVPQNPRSRTSSRT